jgi:hypothetical protein
LPRTYQRSRARLCDRFAIICEIRPVESNLWPMIGRICRAGVSRLQKVFRSEATQSTMAYITEGHVYRACASKSCHLSGRAVLVSQAQYVSCSCWCRSVCLAIIYDLFANVDKLFHRCLYLGAGYHEGLPNMSSPSIYSSASRASSNSSSTTMTSVAAQAASHPHLTPGRASSISIWQESLAGRREQPSMSSDAENESRRAAVEAYQQLKMSLFTRAGASTKS